MVELAGAYKTATPTEKLPAVVETHDAGPPVSLGNGKDWRPGPSAAVQEFRHRGRGRGQGDKGAQ